MKRKKENKNDAQSINPMQVSDPNIVNMPLSPVSVMPVQMRNIVDNEKEPKDEERKR